MSTKRLAKYFIRYNNINKTSKTQIRYSIAGMISVELKKKEPWFKKVCPGYYGLSEWSDTLIKKYREKRKRLKSSNKTSGRYIIVLRPHNKVY